MTEENDESTAAAIDEAAEPGDTDTTQQPPPPQGELPTSGAPSEADEHNAHNVEDSNLTQETQVLEDAPISPKLALEPGLFRDKLKYHYSTLADQHRDSLTLTSSMQSFVKIRIEIEKNYANELRLLSEHLDSKPKNWFDKLLAGQSSSPDVSQFGSVGSMVQHVFSNTGLLATVHHQLAGQLEKQVLQPLEEYDKSSTENSEQLRNRLSLPAQELEQALRNVQKAKDRAHRAMKQCEKKQRDLEQEVKQSAGCSVSGLMEREAKVHDLTTKAKEEDEKYRQAIQEAQEFQQTYYSSDLPGSLDMYQQQVEQRYNKLHGMFASYCEIDAHSIVPKQNANLKLKQAVESLDISQDLVPLFEQAALNQEEQLERPVEYVPFPGSYWSMPSEDDVGVREGTWEKRSLVGSHKRTLGMPLPADFVSNDDVTVMEQQAREQGLKLCGEGEALLKTGDYEKALVKFTRANEKCSFGNDEDGVARAAAGIQMAEDMQGAWSQATVLRTEGSALLRSGEFAAACAKFADAKEAYENSGNHAGAKRADEGLKESETRRISQEHGQKQCDAADALAAEADFDGAAAKYGEAEQMFRKAHDTLGLKRCGDGATETKRIVAARKQAATLMDKGEALAKREKFTQAIGAFEQAEKKFGEGHDDIGTTAAAERITAVSEQMNSAQSPQ